MARSVPSASTPGAVALASAAAMRRFDATLTDADIAAIATALEENAAAAKQLRSKKSRLSNADAPATAFVVNEP